MFQVLQELLIDPDPNLRTTFNLDAANALKKDLQKCQLRINRRKRGQ